MPIVRILAGLATGGCEIKLTPVLIHPDDVSHEPRPGRNLAPQLSGGDVVKIEVAPPVTFRPPDRFPAAAEDADIGDIVNERVEAETRRRRFFHHRPRLAGVHVHLDERSITGSERPGKAVDAPTIRRPGHRSEQPTRRQPDLVLGGAGRIEQEVVVRRSGIAEQRQPELIGDRPEAAVLRDPFDIGVGCDGTLVGADAHDGATVRRPRDSPRRGCNRPAQPGHGDKRRIRRLAI